MYEYNNGCCDLEIPSRIREVGVNNCRAGILSDRCANHAPLAAFNGHSGRGNTVECRIAMKRADGVRSNDSDAC